MELLLLDTTEKEGEDNKLYHYRQAAAVDNINQAASSSWRDLRGVLAAAVGTTSSVCGEPLQCAHFKSTSSSSCSLPSSSGGDATGAVGFVNLYEVLYVLVFPSSDVRIPMPLVQYYTRSSCDLVLSLFGYPDAKLSEWRQQVDGDACDSTLNERLDALFAAVFVVIHQDLSSGTHLQFAFSGRVPAVNYPLEVLAELAVADVLDMSDESLNKAVVAGHCIRFRAAMVLSTIQPSLMRLINQWLLLQPIDLAVHASFVSKDALEGYEVFTFELHDFRFARHGFYPKRHTLLILEREDLQVVYLVEKSLEIGESAEQPIVRELLQSLDLQSLHRLSQLASSKLVAYHDTIREERATSILVDADQQPSFRSYFVVHDRLRDVIIGESFRESCGLDYRSNSVQHSSVSAASRAASAAIFSLFVDRIAAFQQMHQSFESPDSASNGKPGSSSTDPDLPTWIPPVKLDTDDPNTLFLHEKSSDSGADISSEDAHIFPPPGETLFTTSEALSGLETLLSGSRLVHQDAESHVIASSGQRVWIVANYYETVNLFAVFDADVVSLDAIEQEMDRACTFGGYSGNAWSTTAT